MAHIKPADIERESMNILTAELTARGIVLEEETEAVVKRVIHTTADFDYAENLRFTPQAVARGVEALRGGVVVTDTHMALSGVSKPALARLGGTARCFMADPETAEQAKAAGSTRAAAAVLRAEAEVPAAILAVGNAPTALLRIAERIEAGWRPALVIGVPVGGLHPSGGSGDCVAGTQGRKQCRRGHLQRPALYGGGAAGPFQPKLNEKQALRFSGGPVLQKG